MPAPEHDPVQRLNEHHADEILAVARTFGGYSGAASARLVAIDREGLHLEVDDPTGTFEAEVRFRDALPDLDPSLSMRLAFRQLARRATRPD